MGLLSIPVKSIPVKLLMSIPVKLLIYALNLY